MEKIAIEFNFEDLDSPFTRAKLEELPNTILAELLLRHLKRETKAIEYIENDDNYEEGYCDGRLMTYKDDLKPLLDILKGVDKE